MSNVRGLLPSLCLHGRRPLEHTSAFTTFRSWKGVELALVGLLGHFGHHTRKDATGSVLVSESKWLQESG